MLVSKLLVALFALPLAALAQESAAAPESTDAASPDTGAGESQAPASDAGAQPQPTSNGGGGGGGGKNVGADINNTGQGGNGTGSWTVAHFTFPSRTSYWVADKENTALWSPYNEPVNLVLFNSNTTLGVTNTTIAENIPAGTGMWKGNITGFPVGNNYLLTLALTSNPARKIGQTDGFWIKQRNTVPAIVPQDANSAANGPVATGNVNNTNTATASGTNPAGASPSAPSAAPTTGNGSGALSSYSVPAVALVGAVAVALAA